jgi:serine/threonine-protein kinase
MPNNAPRTTGPVALTLALAVSLLSGPRAAAASDPKALALEARTVLKTYCLRCHHGEGSEGGDFDALKAESLTASRDPDKPYVVPGKPAESFLFQRLALRKQGQGDMPPRAVRERPSDADKEAVRKWIEAGAPPFPTEAGRPRVGVREVLTAIRDDLRQADPEERPSLRYFTLNHLHNNPKVPDADLAVYRAALAKAINHLSWKPNIVVPRAVDREQTVFAVDVRKLDWDKDDLWREVLRAYPYGLRHGTARDRDLQKLDDDVAQLTGCDLPYVRADWFAATATRPPLYHTLLRLPKTAGELERLLDVDVQANFRRAELTRAGFAQSGVSGQNRLVERHAARYGAYWKSYDFKEDNRRGNLPRLPLGPAFKDNPFADQAFVQDGGEIIFNLPNGLQGYLLVNGKDERIDAGPTEVVSDSERTSGTPAVITGISCMACHKHGMIAFKDQVRDGTAVAGDARRKVQRLYPPAPEMDEKLREDGDRFLRALEKATGPFLRVGADRGRPVKEFAEPVGEIGRLYRLVDLDLAAAACELDVEKPDDLRALIGASKGLRELGLAPLLQEGGAVKRADWEHVGATSLMQRAAREIERGTPFTVTR